MSDSDSKTTYTEHSKMGIVLISNTHRKNYKVSRNSYFYRKNIALWQFWVKNKLGSEIVTCNEHESRLAVAQALPHFQQEHCYLWYQWAGGPYVQEPNHALPNCNTEIQVRCRISPIADPNKDLALYAEKGWEDTQFAKSNIPCLEADWKDKPPVWMANSYWKRRNEGHAW